MTCYLTFPGLRSISVKWEFKKSLIRLWQGLMHVTCSEQCLKHRKHLSNFSYYYSSSRFLLLKTLINARLETKILSEEAVEIRSTGPDIGEGAVY